MGGGGSTKTTTQVKLTPQQKQLLNLAVPVASSYINPDGTVNASTYGGPTAAPVNANQTLGQNLALGAAMGPVANASNTAMGGLNFLTSGNVLDVNSNPYLRGAIDAAVRPITENYDNVVLGNIRDNASLAGQYGYNRQGLQEAAASRDYLRQTGDTSQKLSFDAYNSGLDAMAKGLAFAPSVIQTGFAPASAVAGVGQQQQQLEQQQIDAKVAEFYKKQFLPLTIAEEIAGMAGGIPGAGSVSSSSGGGTSTLQSVLGLGATGASLASLIGGSSASGSSGLMALLPLLGLI